MGAKLRIVLITSDKALAEAYAKACEVLLSPMAPRGEAPRRTAWCARVASTTEGSDPAGRPMAACLRLTRVAPAPDRLSRR